MQRDIEQSHKTLDNRLLRTCLGGEFIYITEDWFGKRTIAAAAATAAATHQDVLGLVQAGESGVGEVARQAGCESGSVAITLYEYAYITSY